MPIGGLDALSVDKPLPSAATSGRRKYTEYLEQQGANKAKSAKAVKRKELSDEITALEKRQNTVQCAMVSMTKDADTLSEQAKAQNDMTLIMKSNAIHRSAKCHNIQYCKFHTAQIAYIVTIVRGCTLINVGLSVLLYCNKFGSSNLSSMSNQTRN